MISPTVRGSPSPNPARQLSYFDRSRTTRYTISLALPLLLMYEAMAALLPAAATAGVRNAADVMLKSAAYAVGGRWGPPALGLVLVLGAAWLIVRDVRRSDDRPRAIVLAAMFAESAALSVVFGIVVGVVTAQLLGSAGLLAAMSRNALHHVAELAQPTSIQAMPLSARIMLSLGAGVYEEIVFRVLLVGTLAAGARTLLTWRPLAAGLFAATLGALIFSAFHYVGAYGDPLELHSFTFRFVAGLAFSGLFLVRGFGITAWTHALYDIMVLVL